MTLNYAAIEPKWQKAWADARLFESDPDAGRYARTAAFPYVNTPVHIGHIRTYGVADFYVGTSATGATMPCFPWVSMRPARPYSRAKRIAAGDADLMADLRKFDIPDSDIKKMSDIHFNVEYIIKITEEAFRIAGFGIDWRRKLKSVEPIFSMMVEWQFARLNDAGPWNREAIPWGGAPTRGTPSASTTRRGTPNPR